MESWKIEDAQAHFAEFVEAAVSNGPQTVLRDGAEVAVLVEIKEWRRQQRNITPSIKDLLLAPEPRFEISLSRPRNRRRRPPLNFE
jgi:prevent-host-death family protein